MRPWAAALLAAFTFSAAAENRLTVEPRNARADDTIEIVVALEGDAASADSIQIPLVNLKIDSGPSVSSQFSWVNGATRREKSFRYAAHAIAPGRAVVGPLRIGAAVLPAITLQILPAIGDDVHDPETMLRLLAQAGREETFVLAEADKEQAYVGEPIIVTWSLFTAEMVSNLDVDALPELADFWSEELPTEHEPTRDVLIGDRRMRKIPIRRVALFPLRAGDVTVGPLVASAAIMRPYRTPGNPFSALNQEIETITLRAPSRRFAIRPLPGAGFDGVGDFSLRCGEPAVADAGPVSVEVVLSGAGNLRAAGAPHFQSAPRARVESVDGGVRVDKTATSVAMTRTWRLLLFPDRTGALAVPPILFQSFDPAAGGRSTLRCGGWTVNVKALAAASPAAPARSAPPPSHQRRWPVALAIGAAAIAAAILAARLLRRPRARPEEVARVMRHFGEPRNMRTELYELVAERGFSVEGLFAEASERGDAFRAVQSLIDIAEKETLTARLSRVDLERRLRAFLVLLR